jgi:hypothetical protein
MNRDPRFALSQELEAKQTLLDQLRALAADERPSTPRSSTTESSSTAPKPPWINFRPASVAPRTASSSSAGSSAHTLQQIGLKTLRTPTSTLTIAEASPKAIVIAPEDIPARWWKPQPPKLDQVGLTKAIRAREKALKEAEVIPDSEERDRALAEVETLHPVIPGVTASNGGITLIRRV